MENFNNYQDIINAIKAEYVIVRDLKRVANAKKRELNNAHSFVNRKGNEETTLETRVTNAKQDAFTRADNALDTIQSSIDSGYKSALSQSLAKLAFIEAEITKLQNFQSALPEKWESFTLNETNSINSLKGVLTSAINDTKFIYENDIMESSKFTTLKDETKLSIASDEIDIITHYNEIVYGVRQLINSTNDEFQSYVTESASIEDGLVADKNQLVNAVGELVHLKSELSDLLDSNAPQTEIDTKEEAIDSKKSEILELADLAKEKHYAADVFYTQKHKRFSVYFEIIQSLYDEASGWINQPGIFELVTQSRGDHGRSIQVEVRKFAASLLESMEDKMDNQLYSAIMEMFDQVSYSKEEGNEVLMTSYSRMNILDNIESRVYNNQKGKYELDPTVQSDTWMDTFDYFKELHQKASSYIYAKKDFGRLLSGFAAIYGDFSYQMSLGMNQYATELHAAKGRSMDHAFSETKLREGEWTGTPEQESTYDDLISTRVARNRDAVHSAYKLSLVTEDVELFRGMFPAFFSSFQPLFDAKVSTEAARSAAQTEYERLVGILMEADQVIQRGDFAEGTPEYDAAIADRSAKEEARDAHMTNVYSPAMTAKGEAVVALDDFINNYGPVLPENLQGHLLHNLNAEYLRQISEAEVNFGMEVADYESDIQQLNTDIDAIESEMTFVPSTLEDKIRSKGQISDQTYKEYKNYEFWSMFANKHQVYIESLRERLLQLLSYISQHQSTETEALDQIKSFLDGNTAFSALLDTKNYGSKILDRSDKKGEFIGDITRLFIGGNLSPDQYDQYFGWESYRGATFVSDPTFLSERLRQNASNYRMHANPNFIEEIITFVNTGANNF